MDTNQSRLPTTGERITIQGLLAASHLNGKNGIVVKYERESRRYRIQLFLETPATEESNNDKEKKQLAVKSESILLSNDPKKKEWDDRLVHVFCPCHTSDNRRHEQFRQCTRSLK